MTLFSQIALPQRRFIPSRFSHQTDSSFTKLSKTLIIPSILQQSGVEFEVTRVDFAAAATLRFHSVILFFSFLTYGLCQLKKVHWGDRRAVSGCYVHQNRRFGSKQKVWN